MFLTKNYCYIDQNKTGTVYVNNLLKSFNKSYYHKHHQLPSKEIIDNEKIIKFGTIRSPHSWYVSLWSFGCLRKRNSGTYSNLTKLRPFGGYGDVNNKLFAFFEKNMNYIKLKLNYDTDQLYSDPDNILMFRKWLKIVLSDEFAPIVNYPLYHSNLYRHCGLYSKELIKFYFTNHDINKARIDFPLGLSEFLENNCYINDFILLDYLDSNLMSFFEKYNFHLNQSLPKSKRLNVSSKKYNIYDKETYEMVLKKEKIMLNYLLKNWSINFLDNRSKYEE